MIPKKLADQFWSKEPPMQKQTNNFVLLALLTISVISCTNSPKKPDPQEKPRLSFVEEEDGREITGAAAKQAQAHNFVEITFDPTSSELSKKALYSLGEAVSVAKKSGKIDHIIVLSWSDEEYPSKRHGKLSKVQRSLADRRNTAVKNYFNPMPNTDIDTFNMAERPNTLSRWFRTTDTKIKNSLVAAGLPTTGDELQYPSKASHSIVLLKVESLTN